MGLDMRMEWFLPWRCHPLGWGQVGPWLGSRIRTGFCFTSHGQNKNLLSSRLLDAGGEVPVDHREACQKQLSFLEGAKHNRLHSDAGGKVGFLG